jgi:hydroxyacylglutathione hydrolase
MAGQKVEMQHGDIEVLHMPGHTAGSICLKYGRQLFTGDHVLPDISPNIGGGDMRQRGLLKRFLDSLRQTIEMDSQIDIVLPGHGDPFNHLAERCQELIDHHRQRLEQIVTLLKQEGPLSAYGMARCLFGEMHDFHVVLGCAEAQSHLDFLLDEGSINCQQGMYFRE